MQRGLRQGKAKMACFLLLSKLKMQDVCRESQEIRQELQTSRADELKSSSVMLGEEHCDAHTQFGFLISAKLSYSK